MIKITYCSFASDDKFLGGLFFYNELNPREACNLAWALGLNPGGECLCCNYEIEEGKISIEKYMGRLLSKKDLENFDKDFNNECNK
jgi:hypothetical protein